MSAEPVTEERPTVTVAEAAALLGIGKTTLYEAIARGEIPAIKVGSRRVISRSYLNRLLEGN